MTYNFLNNSNYDDCVSHGACSVSPNVSSMQEVMFLLLRQIAYYLIKLKEFNVEENTVTQSLISQIAFMDAAKDLAEAQILDEFSKGYINLVKIRKEYLRLCKEQNVVCADLKNLLKFSPSTSLSSILRKGEKEFVQRRKKLDGNKKYYTEILFVVLKCASLNLNLLYGIGEDFRAASDEILKALNLFNFSKILNEKIKESIDIISDKNIDILKRVAVFRFENYGNLEKSLVSFSTRHGKAIMVSGNNLSDLAALLKFAKDKDIDIYTNGALLIAHAYSYFKKFVNLQGHFGDGTTMLDFATFPGAILLTKNESSNIQYLYRGRLFTTDIIPPKGVVKIKNNDFTPLLESALGAKGFHKGQKRASEIVGFNSTELDRQIDEIACKNYKKIFIINHSSISQEQKEYFETFFTNMPENTFAITFSDNIEQKNVLTVNLANDYPMFCEVISRIFEKIPIDSEKLVFFLTGCDSNSLSGIVNLKNRGAKNMFLSECPPTVINPVVLKEFAKLFKIRFITTSENDLASF